MKLIPQFSIRWLLGVTTVAAIIFSVVGWGVRGHAWAMGVTVGLAALVVLMFVYALLFGAAFVFAGVAARRRGKIALAGEPLGAGPPATGPTPGGEEIPVAAIVVEDADSRQSNRQESG